MAPKIKELLAAEAAELVQRVRANLAGGRPPGDGLSGEQVEALRQRYGRFEDELDAGKLLVSSQFVLNRLDTPRPLLHLMASNHADDFNQWGSFWDQHRGGFSCVDSVLAGKMTSHLDTNYVPTAPEPQDVRRFFIHEQGQSWPLFPVAGYEENKYSRFQCRLGLDTFALSAKRANLRGDLSVLVHDKLPLEVWRLTLTNTSKTARNVSWFCEARVNVDSFPFYYFVPRVVCEGVLEDGAMVFLNHDQNSKHPRTAFFAASEPFSGYDMMGETFNGPGGREVIPAAVRQGKCFNTLGRQPYAGLVAAAQFDAALEPGQSRSWTLVYGKCPTEQQERSRMIAEVRKTILAQPEKTLADLAALWREKVTASAIQTPDRKLDRYFNVWSRYQARNQARFVRALDKVGYRDILQDLSCLNEFEPQFVRNRLLQVLRNQYPDGRAPRQYEKFPGGGHDVRNYHDSPMWIVDTLIRYVKETGDESLLKENVPFLDPKTLSTTSEADTVYGHACRAVRSLARSTGHHGLCAIGYGDWNDSLNKIGGEKGVSVWLSCALVHVAGQMAELAGRLGRGEDAKEFTETAATMTGGINAHAWDGQWYVYAFNDKGDPIGSQQNPEGRLHLNVNTWALFTGVAAAAGREDQVWKALEQLDTPFGHVLLKPSYTLASRNTVGRIADCLPGMFENGSIYMHGESFFLYALIAAGQADKWYEHFLKTLPENQFPDISTNPPHQQSNFFVGPDHPAFGENLFSNFTGSIPWQRRAIEIMLGVIPEYQGLRIAPRPPSSWKRYRVVRRFRGCELDITFKRGTKAGITIDGKPAEALITADLLPRGGRVTVQVKYV